MGGYKVNDLIDHHMLHDQLLICSQPVPPRPRADAQHYCLYHGKMCPQALSCTPQAIGSPEEN